MRKKYGNRAVFEHPIRQLNVSSSEDVEIDSDNRFFKVFFSMGLLLGDNLGLNTTFGTCSKLRR